MTTTNFFSAKELIQMLSIVTTYVIYERPLEWLGWKKYWMMALLTLASVFLDIESCGAQYHVTIGRDISVSALQATSGIPQLTAEDYVPLVHKIRDDDEGVLAIGSIGATSRSSWARFEIFNTKLTEPTQRRGESSSEYMERWLDWDDEMQAGSNRRQKVDLSVKAKKFDAAVRRHLDYSKVEYKSDVFGFLDLAIQLLQEPHRSGKKFIIMGTDGIHAFQSIPYVPLPKDITLIVVNTNKNVGDLRLYKHVLFTSYEGAVNYILNQ